MSVFWEHHLTELREQVLLMGTLAARNVHMALRALDERDDQLAATVEQEDDQLDQLEIQIDELVITFMSTHAPVAKDCRLMLAASKISANLERIGDSATTIARQARILSRWPALGVPRDFPGLRQTVCAQMQEAIDAFLQANTAKATDLIPKDKTANALFRQVAAELTDWMLDDREKVVPAMALHAIARTLERIGDHAVNIAEEVVFLYRGTDIRHAHAGA